MKKVNHSGEDQLIVEEKEKSGNDSPAEENELVEGESTNTKSLRARALGGTNDKCCEADGPSRNKKMIRFAIVMTILYFAIEYTWEFLFT